MKNFLLGYFFAALSLTASAQKKPDQKQPVPKPVIIGTIDSLQSKILNEKRAFWVYVPNRDGNLAYAKTGRYPVVYLLDGDDHFHSLTGLIQYMSNDGSIPPMIVVGIPNTNRERDLTLAFSDSLIAKYIKHAGGGEKFTDFLEKELIPHIEAHYPTQPYRMFIGHSLGGLIAVNTLIHRPNLFNAYLAIDPSMWWDKERVLQEVGPALARHDLTNKALFLTLANNDGLLVDTARVNKGIVPDSTKNPNVKLAALLKSSQNRTLRANYRFYPNEDHGSVPLLSEYDGLRFIFGKYKAPYASKTYFTPGFDADSAFVAYYKDVSVTLGYSVLPPEPLVNAWGYNYLGSRMAPGKSETYLKKAYALFNRNLTNYPNSPNVYDSFGDYYQAKGDTAIAITQYKKALALQEMAPTRKKLIELQAKPAQALSPAEKSKK